MEDYAKGLAESKWECPHESINYMTLQDYWQRHPWPSFLKIHETKNGLFTKSYSCYPIKRQ
ncbi:hypothetical protein QP643_24385 [Klebsiella aerogenes]|nr:hypothetical protein [Klebsiella aerogenes]